MEPCVRTLRQWTLTCTNLRKYLAGRVLGIGLLAFGMAGTPNGPLRPPVMSIIEQSGQWGSICPLYDMVGPPRGPHMYTTRNKYRTERPVGIDLLAIGHGWLTVVYTIVKQCRTGRVSIRSVVTMLVDMC